MNTTAARFTPGAPEQESAATSQESATNITVLPAEGGARKLTLGIKKKVAKTEASKPFLPDPVGELGRIAARIREQREKIEQMEGAVASDCEAVTSRAFLHYVTFNLGRHEPDDSFLIRTLTGPAMVLFPARYPKIKDADAVMPGLRALIGPRTEELFKTRMSITVDCDAIPQDKQQALCDAMVELFDRHGCTDALSQTEETKPVPEFHAMRHRILAPEVNQTLNTAFPIVASVKTKGVKG
jgi:hypothetical protein